VIATRVPRSEVGFRDAQERLAGPTSTHSTTEPKDLLGLMMGSQASSLFSSADRRGTKSTNRPSKRKPSDRSRAMTAVVSEPRRYFGLFPYLSDDLKLTVLSYVADAPLEGMCNDKDYRLSTLTHTIPFVSRRFRDFSRTDLYWKQALIRQVTNEPYLWRSGLLRICREDPRLTHSTNNVDIVEVANALQGTSYKELYAQVLSEQVRFKGPVFFMPGQLQIGEPYGLHFFEPRYRLMIAEVMQHQLPEARRGGKVHGDALFIHANRSPLAPTSPAVLVQVQRCEAYPDGRADVVLVPVSHVWVEKLWVRPDSGHLYYAQCLRMPLSLTHQMNTLARQEALADVMNSLANHISNSDEIPDHDDNDDSSTGSNASQDTSQSDS
jgi:hypothetical protein